MAHQGWTNYETWAVSLWINNDEYLNRYWAEMAAKAVGRTLLAGSEPVIPAAIKGATFMAISILARWLKEIAEAMIAEAIEEEAVAQ